MQHKSFDKAGITIAILCALHCLMLPVVLPTMALMGLSFFGMLWVELVVLAISFTVGGIAVVLGMRHHSSFAPLVALIAAGVLFFFKHEMSAPWEQLAIIVGALLLITAHTLNLYLCRKHNKVPCEQVEEESVAVEAHETTEAVVS
ncbi:MerC domain-containing protein [Aliidiomarina taiwanensis]|uniref:MerC domain-containing protein n=1 Tax=Aliidiomarina taiwanensis TaxID=946228 RepID=A0A432WYR9_9GAMM|nr:MerC domain-containing protein [Aliidiomarina taiwanensis]RUO38867.1 MerC domain-containing protein [Aliidiomarina taiwanensis]